MGSNFDQTMIDRQRSHGLMGLDRARRKSPAMRGKVTEQLRLRLRTLGLGKIAHQFQRSREHRIGLPSSMAPPAAGIRWLAANPTTCRPGFRTERELPENDRQSEGV
jgi:hypothetical protein